MWMQEYKVGTKAKREFILTKQKGLRDSLETQLYTQETEAKNSSDSHSSGLFPSRVSHATVTSFSRGNYS